MSGEMPRLRRYEWSTISIRTIINASRLVQIVALQASLLCRISHICGSDLAVRSLMSGLGFVRGHSRAGQKANSRVVEVWQARAPNTPDSMVTNTAG